MTWWAWTALALVYSLMAVWAARVLTEFYGEHTIEAKGLTVLQALFWPITLLAEILGVIYQIIRGGVRWH